MNPLQKLNTLGQDVWLDDLGRTLFQNGTFEELIRNKEIRGATSNPKILADAMEGNPLYDKSIESRAQLGRTAAMILDSVAIEDVTEAADLLRPVYDDSGGESGFVSIEVSPMLAHDANATVKQAISFWQRVDRPNVFIKIPATDAGLAAITETISLGCNVNVTLLFGLERHRQVMEAFASGLQRRLSTQQPIDSIRSVASFFLSRIDVLVDEELNGISELDQRREKLSRPLLGKTAIALAKLAYLNAQDYFGSEEFRNLRKSGAKPQRLLWASTGTKNPDYSDIMYVEPLIESNTVTTLPMKTLDAYRDHGNPKRRLTDDIEDARHQIDAVQGLGLKLREVQRQLESEGVEKFAKPYQQAVDSLKQRQLEAIRSI